jgi:hypothetical protein
MRHRQVVTPVPVSESALALLAVLPVQGWLWTRIDRRD